MSPKVQEASPIATSPAPIRVVLAKIGLDGHDRGVKIVARALRDAGMHVIYAGLWQTPEAVVRTVADEDADWLGLSLLSGAHLTLLPRVMQLLREAKLEDVGVLVGLWTGHGPPRYRGFSARTPRSRPCLKDCSLALRTRIDTRWHGCSAWRRVAKTLPR